MISGEWPQLLAISPGDHGTHRDLALWIQALGRAGLPGLLIREPHLNVGDLKTLVDVAISNIPFVSLHTKNGHSISLARPGMGLHFSSQSTDWLDLDISGVLRGCSCHSGDAVNKVLEAGADYAFLSPIWSPISKPKDSRPTLGLSNYLNETRRRPVYALGGVDESTFPMVMDSGGFGGAVSGVLFNAPSPEQACEVLGRLMVCLKK